MSRNAIAVAACAVVCALVPLDHAAASTHAGPAIRLSARVTARTFANCDAMHRVYPHGVGRLHAVDHTTGVPVTNFVRNNALYAANTARDRDKDGIACEQR